LEQVSEKKVIFGGQATGRSTARIARCALSCLFAGRRDDGGRGKPVSPSQWGRALAQNCAFA